MEYELDMENICSLAPIMYPIILLINLIARVMGR